MIDLHCHLLPEVDDGPATVEDAVAMARMAVQDGVRTIVATPHGAEWSYTGDESETRDRTAALRSELAARGVDLELLTGLEVYLTPDAATLHAQGRIFTLNGSRYILVEFPMQGVPAYAEQTLFDLQIRRLTPVIAHPERNSQIADNPEIVSRMVDRGMLVQVTAASVVGIFGARTRAAAELLLTRGLAHLLASDAHSIGGRSPVLSGAVRRASKLIGEAAATAMVTTAPAAVLRDAEVASPEPRPARRRSWFPFGRKRSQ